MTSYVFVFSLYCTLTGFTFCQRLTPEEYEKERFSCTIREIQKLKAAVDMNCAISIKKKKKMMKEFVKYHPLAFSNPVLN